MKREADLTSRVDRIERKIDKLLASRSIYLGDHKALTFLENGQQRLIVDTQDIGIAPLLLASGRWERHITNLFRRLIKKGDTVLDIGANFGYFSVIAAGCVGDRGKVLSFEANPYLASLLERTFRANAMFQNDMVQLHNKGVMDKSGTLALHVRKNYFGGGTFLSSQKDFQDDMAEEIVSVVALDEFLPPEFTANVVKIDIEGAEPLALKGMSRIIRRSPGIKLIIEYSPNRYKNVMPLNEFFDMIENELGLKMHFITQNGVQVADRDAVLSSGFTNLLLKS